MTTINDLLRQHVTLDIDCLDRLYLNGYAIPARDSTATPHRLSHPSSGHGYHPSA